MSVDSLTSPIDGSESYENMKVLTLLGSFIWFNVLNVIVQNCGLIPESALKSSWKWKNTLLSFVHAAITGVGTLLWLVTTAYNLHNHDPFIDLISLRNFSQLM